jgi:hypothetical protein
MVFTGINSYEKPSDCFSALRVVIIHPMTMIVAD